ncbi:MAG: nitroreductase family protein [Paracoccaceae bacterium]|jgi:FMN reductase [NAD(P)H]|nr:nitroreductase family protein [Paracoccaceae bacterium]
MTDKLNLHHLLAARFDDAPDAPVQHVQSEALCTMASRGSCRSFKDTAVASDLIQILCATALSSPSKSDLQQRDIIVIDDPHLRQQLAALVPDQTWIADAPNIAVFCGNNRRQRAIHDIKGIPFANDHLDALFNAIGDAAIALGAFVTAAEAVGLGCCPISGIRNNAAAVSDLLGLPQHVFPFAGLAFGHPTSSPTVSKRLPLRMTTHINRYNEGDIATEVAGYDADRADAQPYVTQRLTDTYGTSDSYGWSDDKTRQYSVSERDGFGAFIRSKGFNLD